MKYWDKAITLTTGCTKISPACLHCWAETNHNLRMRQHKRYDHDFSEVKVHPENISIIDKIRKPTTFSVWNDAFYPAVPFVVLDILFEAINRNPQHTYLICTKRPERISECLNRVEDYSFLAHTHKIFLGTTVENQEMADKRIPELLKCSPFKLFLSVEPMLERLWMPQLSSFDFVIAGCESGTKARNTDKRWIKDLKEQCIESETHLWVKQIKINGKMVYDYQPLSTIKKEDLWK